MKEYEKSFNITIMCKTLKVNRSAYYHWIKNGVQLKRIVIDEVYLGIGQEALGMIERYCKDVLGTIHLWLDVYADNARAIHVYEKLGFRYFKDGIENSRKVLFYEKSLHYA